MMTLLTQREALQALNAVQIAFRMATLEAQRPESQEPRAKLEARRAEWFELAKKLSIAAQPRLKEASKQ